MVARETLGKRLGKTEHVSPLRIRLQRLLAYYPSDTASCLEQWLIDVANNRGARIVVRPHPPRDFVPPPEKELANTDLVAALCQLQCLDQPQILRLAAQLISQGLFDEIALSRIARQERVEPILAELARLALKVEPTNPHWRKVAEMFPVSLPLREPLLHWTRLAQPVLRDGRCNAASWKLVA